MTSSAAVTAPSPIVAGGPIFELDADDPAGNGAVDSPAGSPDDWSALFANGANTGASAAVFTGIICDKNDQGSLGTTQCPAVDFIFDGSNKDIQDITAWVGKDSGGLPDKDNLTHGAAASYPFNVAGPEQIFYVEADRFANNGDAFLGVWFFRESVQFDSNPSSPTFGRFLNSTGGLATHTAPTVAGGTDGDILLIMDFPQAQGGTAHFSVGVWDPGFVGPTTPIHCLGSSDPSAACFSATFPTECSDTVHVPLSGVCISGDKTNFQTAPWPYKGKPNNTPAGKFIKLGFFEAGFRPTQFGITNLCFSSVLIETRSSRQFTATLKDFILGSFATCAIDCDGTGFNCSLGQSTPADTVFSLQACIKNSAQTTIPAGSQVTFNFTSTGGGGLFQDAAHTIPLGSVTVPLAADLVFGGANACFTFPNVHSDQPEGTWKFSASVTFQGITLETVDKAACAGNFSCLQPDLNVTKSCVSVLLVPNGGQLCIKVSFEGDVINLGNLPFSTVTLIDDPNAAITPSSFPLAVGQTVHYTGNYMPTAADGGVLDPCLAVFTDTIRAVGNFAGCVAPSAPAFPCTPNTIPECLVRCATAHCTCANN